MARDVTLAAEKRHAQSMFTTGGKARLCNEVDGKARRQGGKGAAFMFAVT